MSSTSHKFSDDDIREQLKLLIESSHMNAAAQMTAFLTFVVEKTLSGQSCDIKAYTVAVDALQRPETFDPQTDPTVRVLAGRLRNALDLYYATDGKADKIRIALPKGSYVPTFKALTPGTTTNLEGFAARTCDKFRTRAWWKTKAGMITASTTLAITTSAIIALSGNTQQTPQNKNWMLQTSPVIDVLPFTTSKDLGLIAEGLRRQLAANLANFKSIRVHVVDDNDTASQQTTKSELHYQLKGLLLRIGNKLQFTVDLAEDPKDLVIWSQTVRVQDDKSGINKLVADKLDAIVTSLASTSGLIQAETMKRLRNRPIIEQQQRISDYECMVRFRAFDLQKKREDELLARNCLKALTEAKSTSGSIWAAHALIRFFDWTNASDKSDISNFQSALGAAENAIRLEPTNPFGYMVKGYAVLSQGNREEAIELFKRAQSLNPLNPTTSVLIGWANAVNGNWTDGIATVKQAIDRSPAAPGWFHMPLSLAAFRIDDYAEALRHAEQVIHAGDQRGYALAIPPAMKLGKTEIARQYIQMVNNGATTTPHDPLQPISRIFHNPDLMQKYSAVLKQAGLQLN